jgi:hypothetical protein
MTFQAYCFACGKKVTAMTLLDGEDLALALENNTDIEVVHLTENDGDHRWKLNNQEKENIRNAKAAGTFPFGTE